jgi:hypothetical protein
MPDPAAPHQVVGTFIVLTPADADQVRMLTVVGHACAPVPLKNGTLILPIELLADPFHAVHKAFLETLATRDNVWSDEYADGALYPQEVQNCIYDSSWQEGVPVVVELPATMK